MNRLSFLLLLALVLHGSASAGERFLFQVVVNQPGDYERMILSGLIPTARMRTSMIAEGSRADAAAAGLPSRALVLATAEGPFYLIYPPPDKSPGEVRETVARHCEILAEDADAFFVRASPEQAESLLPLQFHLARVHGTPLADTPPSPGEPPRTASFSQVIQWIIDQITVGELSGMLRDLTGERATMVRGSSVTIRTRDSRTVGNSDAIWYFYERASSYAGMDSVKFDPFSWITRTDSNVVVTKVGRRFPRQQYLIGGHIDATSEQSQTYAPGADDNATSTLAALIAAKVTRQIPFKRTIKFVAFNCEEQGIWGSDHYASQARSRGDSLLGGLVPDMVGSNFSGNDSALAFHGNRSGTIPLTDRFYQMDTTYHIGLRVRRTANPPGGSDYQSFWDYNYEAGCFSEKDFSLVYHTTNDRISQMDTVYWTKYVKCLVATLCDLAEPDTVFSGAEAGENAEAGGVLELGAVAPNPLTGWGAIQYALPRGSEVRLAVYDASGRCLRTLVQGWMGAGRRTVSWDSRGLVPGVYFCRLEAGGASRTRKLVVLK
jgi:aminopeptidase YwaD